MPPPDVVFLFRSFPLFVLSLFSLLFLLLLFGVIVDLCFLGDVQSDLFCYLFGQNPLNIYIYIYDVIVDAGCECNFFVCCMYVMFFLCYGVLFSLLREVCMMQERLFWSVLSVITFAFFFSFVSRTHYTSSSTLHEAIFIYGANLIYLKPFWVRIL